MIVLVVVLGLGVGVGFLIGGGEEVALPQSTVTVDPPDPFTTGLPFSEPPAVRSANKRLKATLIARNSTSQVSGVEVEGTQSYTAKWRGGVTESGFLGPTLRVRPGDTVELTLDNRLKVPDGPKALNCAETGEHHEAGHARQGKPGDPELTNVHFHGLHVTPRERSPYGDTVLVHLPNGKSRIRFKIRRNHDKGTFWYHAHLHQCTDDEVTRGLAGLLLVGDSRKDLPKRLRRIKTRSLALKDIQVVPGDERGDVADRSRARVLQSHPADGERAGQPEADHPAGRDPALAAPERVERDLVPGRPGRRVESATRGTRSRWSRRTATRCCGRSAGRPS